MEDITARGLKLALFKAIEDKEIPMAATSIYKLSPALLYGLFQGFSKNKLFMHLEGLAAGIYRYVSSKVSGLHARVGP